jgi:drug/metabolite transporter (DMT)-like permease
MFVLVVKVVVVSIVVSLLARWVGMIPRYPKLRYAALYQFLNSGLLTVLLTVLLMTGINPPWVFLLLLLLLVMWGSVLCTNYVVRRGSASKGVSPPLG